MSAGRHVAFVRQFWEQNVLFLPGRLQAMCTSKWHATYMDVSVCRRSLHAHTCKHTCAACTAFCKITGIPTKKQRIYTCPRGLVCIRIYCASRMGGWMQTPCPPPTPPSHVHSVPTFVLFPSHHATRPLFPPLSPSLFSAPFTACRCARLSLAARRHSCTFCPTETWTEFGRGCTHRKNNFLFMHFLFSLRKVS